MVDLASIRSDMAFAERAVRAALADSEPGAMSRLLSLYHRAAESERAALVAVLAARIALAERRS